MTVFHRRSVFAFFLGATLAAAVLVGRSAFATAETISACFKPSNGTLYLLGESTGRQECQPGDIPISWNTAGVNGQDGVSVRSESLAPDPDGPCPNGGSKFTSVDGVTYACNGANGVDGQDGQDGVDGQDGQDGVDGQDGADFDGTFTSPNGLFKVVVDNTTAKIEGPSSRVQITAGNVQVQTNGLLTASGAVTTIGNGGSQIFLNGPGCGVLRSTDVNPFIPPTTGGFTLLNPNGSPNVRTPC